MSTATPVMLRGRVVTPTQVIDDGLVVFDGDRIAWVGPCGEVGAQGYDTAHVPAPVADTTILPGLVDIHCHGGGGESFPDSTTAEQALAAAHEHLRHGTTSLVASLVTAPPDVLLSRVEMLAGLCDDGELAGIHLEGPFLSKARCGAQNPDFMQVPDAGLVRQVAELARGWFATMTIAPEVPGNTGPQGVGVTLCEVGALPSLGHTDASAEQLEMAVSEEVAALAQAAPRSNRPTATHLFNGMRPIHHRDPGPALACLAAAARGEMVVEMVADGTHLHPDAVREVFDLLGADNIMLITDAMAAAGMPDGDYVLGASRVRVVDGVARLADGDSIAGGTAHLLDVLRTTVAGGVDVVDATRSASTVPATVLGKAGEYGALRAGLRADAVVTDADLRPVRVYRRGAQVA